MNFGAFRKALWHVRKGGVPQLRRHLEHQRRLREMAEQEQEQERPAQVGPIDVPEWEPNPHYSGPYRDVRVGVIMDEFSLYAWEPEFTLVPLSPLGWREEIVGLDMLLVESAWQGNGGAWAYQVVGSQAPSQSLRDVVLCCQEQGIPTVFWNKEDPAHFEDFLDSAVLFDVIATTDSSMVEKYREVAPAARVIVVPFAVQPAIHNPIRDQAFQFRGKGDVCFAGTYFRHKFPDRREQMDLILGAAAQASESLRSDFVIYSRNEDVDEKYAFPEEFSPYVVGALDYPRMLSAYRAFKVFTNVNTVTDSPTMFSRRVLEIVASGTVVATTPAQGITACFGEVLPTVTDRESGAAMMESLVRSPQLRDRVVHRGQRILWQRHTYAHRAAQILEAAGLSSSLARPRSKVSVLLSTNRPENLVAALHQVTEQIDVDVELLVATHGFEPDPLVVGDYPDAQFFPMPAHATLGECLNALVTQASGEYCAKIDDDDLYAPHYLCDQVNALRFSGADVVGKQASYLYLEQTNELVLRKPWREHIFTDLVAGPTLVAPIHVFREHPFAPRSQGEDTQFLHDVRETGGVIYSADRFNYIQVRSAQGVHTWDVTVEQLKRSGTVESFGCNTDHVFVGE